MLIDLYIPLSYLPLNMFDQTFFWDFLEFLLQSHLFKIRFMSKLNIPGRVNKTRLRSQWRMGDVPVI